MTRIYVDPTRCTGCKTCEIACAVQHSESKTLLGALSQPHPPQKRLYVETSGGVKMPILCRHCEDAPCVNSCITGCLYHDENGYVRRKKGRCIGCWTCTMVCPFGVIGMDSILHIAVKCDRCHKREIPACVESCPTKALSLVDAETVPQAVREKVVLSETRTGG